MIDSSMPISIHRRDQGLFWFERLYRAAAFNTADEPLHPIEIVVDPVAFARAANLSSAALKVLQDHGVYLIPTRVSVKESIITAAGRINGGPDVVIIVVEGAPEAFMRVTAPMPAGRQFEPFDGADLS